MDMIWEMISDADICCEDRACPSFLEGYEWWRQPAVHEGTKKGFFEEMTLRGISQVPAEETTGTRMG